MNDDIGPWPLGVRVDLGEWKPRPEGFVPVAYIIVDRYRYRIEGVDKGEYDEFEFEIP